MSLEELITTRARQAQQEIEAMADAARIELGWKRSTVNRRRGQLRRHQRKTQGEQK